MWCKVFPQVTFPYGNIYSMSVYLFCILYLSLCFCIGYYVIWLLDRKVFSLNLVPYCLVVEFLGHVLYPLFVACLHSSSFSFRDPFLSPHSCSHVSLAVNIPVLPSAHVIVWFSVCVCYFLFYFDCPLSCACDVRSCQSVQLVVSLSISSYIALL